MRSTRKHSLVPQALVILVAGLSSGCTVHAGYNDPYYHDRHPWGGETVYYEQ